MTKNLSSNRRQFGRRKTHIHAIAFIPSRGSVHCVVSDLSEDGARIEIDGQVALPPVIRLEIAAIGVQRLCNVRHHGGHGCGVAFIDQATADRILTRSEAMSWRRNARLRQPQGRSGVHLRDEVQAAAVMSAAALHSMKPFQRYAIAG